MEYVHAIETPFEGVGVVAERVRLVGGLAFLPRFLKPTVHHHKHLRKLIPATVSTMTSTLETPGHLGMHTTRMHLLVCCQRGSGPTVEFGVQMYVYSGLVPDVDVENPFRVPSTALDSFYHGEKKRARKRLERRLFPPVYIPHRLPPPLHLPHSILDAVSPSFSHSPRQQKKTQGNSTPNAGSVPY